MIPAKEEFTLPGQRGVKGKCEITQRALHKSDFPTALILERGRVEQVSLSMSHREGNLEMNARLQSYEF